MDFLKWLRELDHGRSVQRLGEELGDVIEGVNATSGKGTLTITIKVKREGMQAVVDIESTPKIPKHPHHGTLFFWDPKNPRRITRGDPRQLELKQLPQQVMADMGESDVDE